MPRTFIPGTNQVQDHIHLSALDDGILGFDGDHAPPYKLKVYKRMPKFEGVQQFQRAWNGTPFDMVLGDATNKPLIFTGFTYQIRLDLDNEDIIQQLLYRRVYMIDNRHPNNGVSHAGYVRTMYMSEMPYEENLDPMLAFNILNISFNDMDTVAPV